MPAMTYEALLSNDNDVIIKGHRCITTPTELYQALVEKDTSEIILHREFADKYFTPSGLADLMNQAKTINQHCRMVIDADVRDFETDMVRQLYHYPAVDDLMYMLESRPADMMGVIKKLCKNYMDTYSETLVANNKVSALQLQNTELQRRIEDMRSDYDALVRDKSLVETKLGQLVGRINYSYNKDVDPSQFIQIEGKSRYTKILYIKERVRVRYVDTLIYYLKEILRRLYEVPVREVVIGPYYAYEGAQMYPHLAPSFDLSYTKLYQSDIYMPGFQPRVMEDVLKNPSNVEYLIILDRCGMGVPHVLGDSVEYVYTMSDPVDNYDNLPASRVISYFHETLHIPHVEGFDEMSSEDKMRKYSDMQITKFLMSLLEKRGV